MSEASAGREPHLVLVGMMGAGKTTVGTRCAERLGRGFVDTDELVIARTGRSIADIFVADGEPAFRAHERAAVAEACASSEPFVIACGGGAVLDPENRQVLRAHGVVVWLRASPPVLAARVAQDGTERPLLGSMLHDAEARLTELEEQRDAAYRATAHVTVDTSRRTVDEVVDVVLEELARCPV